MMMHRLTDVVATTKHTVLSLESLRKFDHRRFRLCAARARALIAKTCVRRCRLLMSMGHLPAANNIASSHLEIC
jgi:hypothetical protein